MLVLASEDIYTKAILISGDRDFVPVVEVIRIKYNKHITNADFSKEGITTALQKACTDYIALNYEVYLKQFLTLKNQSLTD